MINIFKFLSLNKFTGTFWVPMDVFESVDKANLEKLAKDANCKITDYASHYNGGVVIDVQDNTNNNHFIVLCI